MAEPRTGAERYLAARLEDPEYREAFEQARERIGQIDRVIRVLDDRRNELKLTKADLARRAGVKPEAIRRLFSAEKPNPTLSTLVALAVRSIWNCDPSLCRPGGPLLEDGPPLLELGAEPVDDSVVARIRCGPRRLRQASEAHDARTGEVIGIALE